MLVLTRRVGETLTIGEHGEITVTILRVQGNQVRIGINAPADIPVHREEIFRRIQSERLSAQRGDKKEGGIAQMSSKHADDIDDGEGNIGNV